MLSFNPSTPVKIFSKDMNDGGEIWGVEVSKLINRWLGKVSVVADSSIMQTVYYSIYI